MKSSNGIIIIEREKELIIMKYFIMISKMELSKKLKVKCCIEVALNIILRIFTFYPFLLINYVFTLFEKVFDFLDNLFYNISTFSKKIFVFQL